MGSSISSSSEEGDGGGGSFLPHQFNFVDHFSLSLLSTTSSSFSVSIDSSWLFLLGLLLNLLSSFFGALGDTMVRRSFMDRKRIMMMYTSPSTEETDEQTERKSGNSIVDDEEEEGSSAADYSYMRNRKIFSAASSSSSSSSSSPVDITGTTRECSYYYYEEEEEEEEQRDHNLMITEPMVSLPPKRRFLTSVLSSWWRKGMGMKDADGRRPEKAMTTMRFSTSPIITNTVSSYATETSRATTTIFPSSSSSSSASAETTSSVLTKTIGNSTVEARDLSSNYQSSSSPESSSLLSSSSYSSSLLLEDTKSHVAVSESSSCALSFKSLATCVASYFGLGINKVYALESRNGNVSMDSSPLVSVASSSSSSDCHQSSHSSTDDDRIVPSPPYYNLSCQDMYLSSALTEILRGDSGTSSFGKLPPPPSHTQSPPSTGSLFAEKMAMMAETNTSTTATPRMSLRENGNTSIISSPFSPASVEAVESSSSSSSCCHGNSHGLSSSSRGDVVDETPFLLSDERFSSSSSSSLSVSSSVSSSSTTSCPSSVIGEVEHSGGAFHQSESIWKDSKWVGGMFMSAIMCPAFSMGAMEFLPASVVGFAGVQILFVMILARQWLKEDVSGWNFTGAVFVILGLFMVSFYSGRDPEFRSVSHFLKYFTTDQAIIYLALTGSVMFCGLWYYSDVYIQWLESLYFHCSGCFKIQSIILPCTAGLFGGYAGLGAKSIVMAITAINTWKHAASQWRAVFIILFTIVFALVELLFINRCLQKYKAIAVVPVVNSVITLTSGIGAIVMFQEYPRNAGGWTAGLILVIGGVVILSYGNYIARYVHEGGCDLLRQTQRITERHRCQYEYYRHHHRHALPDQHHHPWSSPEIPENEECSRSSSSSDDFSSTTNDVLDNIVEKQHLNDDICDENYSTEESEHKV